jgi:hypothetical protein
VNLHYTIGVVIQSPPDLTLITAPILHRAIHVVMREAIPLRLRRLRRLRRRAPRPTVRELRRDHIECLLEVITRPEYRAGGLNRLERYGIITWAQLEAGIEYAELIRDYHRVIEAPQPRTRPSKIERAKLAAIPREDEGRTRLERWSICSLIVMRRSIWWSI